jgi:DNA-binding CsgD family transcriptional regulator
MAEGTRFARKPKLTKREALKRVAAGETLREIALSYNVDHSTIRAARIGALRTPAQTPIALS